MIRNRFKISFRHYGLLSALLCCFYRSTILWYIKKGFFIITSHGSRFRDWGGAISSIIIDGYNIIGTVHNNIEKAREDLIDLIIQYKTIKAHDITIVFDGYKSGQGNESRVVRGGVAVIYSRLAEKADEVIKRIITKERKEWIVVSSDREIANHAWAVNSVPVPSDAFIRTVSKKTAGKGIPDRTGHEAGIHVETVESKDSGEYDEDASAVKGNPHKLSKREKSVRRALSKL